MGRPGHMGPVSWVCLTGQYRNVPGATDRVAPVAARYRAGPNGRRVTRTTSVAPRRVAWGPQWTVGQPAAGPERRPEKDTDGVHLPVAGSGAPGSWQLTSTVSGESGLNVHGSRKW